MVEIANVTVAARRAAMLPGLLTLVRRRRRRRLAARTALAAAAIGLVGLALQMLRGDGLGRQFVEAPWTTWTVIRDDASVLERLGVAATVRDEWFVDDGALRTLLDEAQRPSGTVRVGDQLFVAAGVVDSFMAGGS